MDINYETPNFVEEVMAAFDRGGDINIMIGQRKAALVDKAMNLHDDYFQARTQGRRPISLLVKFGLLGIRTPSLWVVLNKAELLERPIKKVRTNDGLLISIK